MKTNLIEKTCVKCGYIWSSKAVAPAQCPSCYSRKWRMMEKKPIHDEGGVVGEEKKCTRCGHHWTSKKVKPQQCPKCKSKLWNRPKGENNKQAYNLQRKVRRLLEEFETLDPPEFGKLDVMYRIEISQDFGIISNRITDILVVMGRAVVG